MFFSAFSHSSFQCRLKDCIPGALLVTSPLLDKSVTADQLAAIESSLNKVTKISNITKEGGKTHTMLQFPKQEDGELNEPIQTNKICTPQKKKKKW